MKKILASISILSFLFLIAFLGIQRNKKELPVFVTFYGWSDNDPPGNAIAFPKEEQHKTRHDSASGIGTYDNPLTMATDPSEFPVGTRLYIPYLQKYVIMEDTCATCIRDWQTKKKYHIDIWMESDEKHKDALEQCEEKWTREATPIEINPPTSRPVNTQPLFDSKTGTCL